MDLTIEEPEERVQNRRRGRMAYFEEGQESENSDNNQIAKNIQPPSNLGISQRYQIYWSEVSGKERVATHLVTLDIDPHLIVLDVIDMSLQELAKTVRTAAARLCLQVPALKWEMRFAGRDGLPRYDYPCRPV